MKNDFEAPWYRSNFENNKELHLHAHQHYELPIGTWQRRHQTPTKFLTLTIRHSSAQQHSSQTLFPLAPLKEAPEKNFGINLFSQQWAKK